MNRKERREMERKVKHLAKTKPWELKAMIGEKYDRKVVECRVNNEVLAPGDRVMLDMEHIMADPDYPKYRQDYKDYILANANKVFTLSREAKTSGPFAFVSFDEDETEPKNLFYLGYVKKVKSNDSNDT